MCTNKKRNKSSYGMK